eukprot:TRINITY_DN9152_c0_g2_i1.p1 TRINITY_DN9152_c0_g2~~TRINITY_DN9152_c0_g2_i1.p1  ORF type:complete len:978 (+),score=282.35 TRINITY_DN9152_c0_g2_i1:166-2934(+)
MDVDKVPGEGAIVLHEDKKYYPDAEEVYGEDVQVVVGEEDAQPIEKPIIAPKVEKNFNTATKEKGKKLGSQDDYITHLMKEPKFIRNVSLAGHLGHGKTTFMDYLLNETGRYTDIRLDEQDRGISIKPTPVSTLLESEKGKNYLFNMFDTPGHVNFIDEVCASTAISDGVVLVVDAVEGVMVNTKQILRQVLSQGLPVVLLFNKMDRLILELKLPPHDAFRKIQHVIGELNTFISEYTPLHPNYSRPPRFSPEQGNVCFSSGRYGFSFTVKSFARIYRDFYGGSFDVDRFSKRLWGDIYYSEETRKFSRSKEDNDDKISFVTFILEPLYKIFGKVISEEGKELKKTVDDLGVHLFRYEQRLDAEPLLKLVASRFFENPSGFVEMCVEAFPNPVDSAQSRVPWLYTGSMSDPTAQSMLKCDKDGELMVYITKLFHRNDASTFDAYGRVMSGVLKSDSQVRVLGESYTEDDPEDVAIAETQRLWLAQGRHKIEIDSAPAGSWVLIEGVDNTIIKTATICSTKNDNARVFSRLSFPTSAVVKIAVEPLSPSELPKMVEGLRKIEKTYPLAQVKQEESGEHVVIGTGEIHLDCIMHDLRKMYTEEDVEVKVADPVTTFCETVIETSAMKCFAETPNKKNKIAMMAEPLEKGLATAIEKKAVSLDMGKKTVRMYFENEFGWDTLAARSVWAFGPDTQGPNVLLDDTIPSEVDRPGLLSIKDSVVQGFQWGTREGPLCDERIRGVKFKLMDASVAEEAIHKGSGQIIPTARRVAYSAFLLANPRLMEPIYAVEIVTPVDCIAAIYTIMARRRGNLESDEGKPGTPLYVVKGYVPIMDSFGLETDLRTHTQGQAFIQSVFDHWSIVPGDPLDRDIVLRPLEPSQPHFLARDYMVKTRRRKGMAENVSINKYFDDEMLLEMARQDVEPGM